MNIYTCTDCGQKRMGTPASVERIPTTEAFTYFYVIKSCPGCHQTDIENEELWKLEKKNQVHANWVDDRPDQGVHINDLRRAAGLPDYVACRPIGNNRR
jgi:hypothetical protein